MSCCGKKLNAIKNIATGKINNFIGKDYMFTDDRIKACEECGMNTWLSKKVYIKWVMSHFIETTRNIEDLTTIPSLPKKSKKDGAELYCTLCKCRIGDKARARQNTCPKGKWDK